jgi:hypothetical protein
LAAVGEFGQTDEVFITEFIRGRFIETTGEHSKECDGKHAKEKTHHESIGLVRQN